MDGLETIFGIVLFVMSALILLAVAVGPIFAIIAYTRTRQIGELREQLTDMLRRIGQIEAGRVEMMDVLPAAEPVAEAEPPPVRRRSRRIVEPRISPIQDSAHIESFIGRRVLAWVAAGLLVLAASFFLNYAVRSHLIGPAGQIAVVALAGAALCVWGYRRHTHGGQITTQLITGTGITVLFLAVYAAFSVYPLLSPPMAGVYLTILMGQAALLAVLYRSQAIAFMAVIGGLLTPLLIRQVGDPYVSYFLYLLLLNIVIQGLFALRPWLGLRILMLLGTQGLFWLWFLDRYHPEKQSAVLVFQFLLAAAYLAPDWLAARKRVSRDEDWVLQIAVPWLLFLVFYRALGEFHPAWMGTLSLTMATVWTLATFAASRPMFVRDAVRPLVFLATALAFLGLSFPLQAKSYWATVGWVAEGAVLWWLGLRIRSQLLRGAGAIFLALAGSGAIYVMTVHAPEVPYMVLFNRRTLTVLAAAAGLFAAALAARAFKERLDLPDQVVRYSAGLGGVVLVWIVLSLEVWDGVRLFVDDSESLVPHTALSFAWALYAGLLLAVGFRLRHAATRWTALGLFSMTLLKLLFYDLSELEGVYRVLTFFMGAVVLAAAAAAYRWVQLAQLNQRREASHE